MTRPTKLDVMQRRRRIAEQAAAAREAEQQWDELRRGYRDERSDSFDDTKDWLADTRDHARAYKPAMPVEQPPRPPRAWFLRRWMNFAMGLGENA